MNMNTYSSLSTPLKAMMACLQTLIFLILMKMVRNSIPPLISENQLLTFQALSYIKIFSSEAITRQNEKRRPFYISHVAGGSKWECLQRPTANWSCSKLWSKIIFEPETSHGEISTEMEHLYGFQHMLWVASTQRGKANNRTAGKYFHDNRWAGSG